MRRDLLFVSVTIVLASGAAGVAAGAWGWVTGEMTGAAALVAIGAGGGLFGGMLFMLAKESE